MSSRLPALCSLVPLVLGPAPLFSAWLRPADPQHLLPSAPAQGEVPFLSWPQSQELLELIEGGRTVDPQLGSLQVPTTHNGRPALSYGRGLALVEWMRRSAEQCQTLFEELRGLTLRATQADPRQLVVLDTQTRQVVQALDRLTHLRRHGLQPLASEGAFFVFFPDARHEPEVVRTSNLFPSQLAGFTLLGSNLSQWLSRIDAARVSARWALRDIAQDTAVLQRESRSTRGLREVQQLLLEIRGLARQAVAGTENTSDRTVLQSDFERATRRVVRVIEETRLGAPSEPLHGFQGGQVWLERADPGSAAVLFDVPLIDAHELIATGALFTMTSATCALFRAEAAIEIVAEQRLRVFEAQLALRGQD